MPPTLKVNEMFRTIEGEGTRAGRRCGLVRLTGCNLRCRWCDTAYAYEEGRQLSIDEILAEVAAMRVRLVMVTGGEPLLQPAAGELLKRLCDGGYEALLETNGSLDVSGVDPRVARCIDVKCPGSGESESFLWSNLHCLRAGDEVKFVLADRGDYDYARKVILDYDMGARCPAVLTPAAGLLAPAALAEWMLADAALPPTVRLGLQMQKIIWPDARRGV